MMLRTITALLVAAVLSTGFPVAAQVQSDAEKMRAEAEYYAPIRYVIVYNAVYKLAVDERRVSVLLLPEQFTRENLVTVFDLVKKRFPTPVALRITVHTSLATLETPEEAEMAKDSENSRFREQANKFNSAFFRRDVDGENFCYTTSLKPYKMRWAFPFPGRAEASGC